jgi:hypothetical protein
MCVLVFGLNVDERDWDEFSKIQKIELNKYLNCIISQQRICIVLQTFFSMRVFGEALLEFYIKQVVDEKSGVQCEDVTEIGQVGHECWQAWKNIDK